MISIENTVIRPMSEACCFLAELNDTYELEGVGGWSYDHYDGYAHGPLESQWPTNPVQLEALAEQICQDLKETAKRTLLWITEEAEGGNHTPWLQQAHKLSAASELYWKISSTFGYFRQ